jgi:hypothetical protein
MSTHQFTGNRWGTDARDDIITGQTRIAADPTAYQAHDSITQMVRQGQDTSLRSLQVWADLARSAAGTTMFSPIGHSFEKLLVAQRQLVDELVATQREFAQQLVDAAGTSGDSPVRR